MHKSPKIFMVLFLLLGLTAAARPYAPQYGDDKPQLTLRWKGGPIKVALSNSLVRPNPNVKADSDVEGAVRRSFQAWEHAAGVRFETIWSEKQSVSPAGNVGDGVSLVTIAQTPENLLLFSKDAEEVSARTRVFFNKKGLIIEADVVLNPYQQFSTDGSIGTFDLESTLTHEIGHLLGLEHSAVFGATMHENNGKNGIFNLPAFVSRTLAASDVASIRAIYGPAAGEAGGCCGTISGKLLAGAKAARNFSVWAEDAQTGAVVAEIATGADGGFRLDGLARGDYRVYAQTDEGENSPRAAEEIGQVSINDEKPVTLVKKLAAAPNDFDLHYLGFNGQLSELSVALNPGKSYTLFVGGRGLNARDFKIDFNSPFVAVIPNTLGAQDYGDGVSVLSFEIAVSRDAPLGEYSLAVESRKGNKRYIIGGLAVEDFVNPWNNSVLTGN